MPVPFPSRRLMFRAERYAQRLAVVAAVLDAVPDRGRPLPRAVARSFRRTLDEGRALVGAPPSRRLRTTLLPLDFVAELVTVSHLLAGLEAPRNMAIPGVGGKSNPRRSALW